MSTELTIPGLLPEPVNPVGEDLARIKHARKRRCQTKPVCSKHLPIGPRCGHPDRYVTEKRETSKRGCTTTWGHCPNCEDVPDCPLGRTVA
jgi:hypothetical protein